MPGGVGGWGVAVVWGLGGLDLGLDLGLGLGLGVWVGVGVGVGRWWVY